MDVAGIILTGGLSRRMGRDKASIVVPGRPGSQPETLAARSARILSEVAAPAIEVGPGHTGLAVVADTIPAGGPLTAIHSGFADLGRYGWFGAVVVIATDMPFLQVSMITWLAEHPSNRSVVPLWSGRAQPLCARYTHRDLCHLAPLIRSGSRSMSDLIRSVDPVLAPPGTWPSPTSGPAVLDDVDTPQDLSAAWSRL